ncbi:MAG: sulfotransferase, partial [Acidimicrobiales bacterium]|nr:sulfotransferase [Acidimicrobiales bacterium]
PMHSAAGNPMRFGSRTVTLRLDDDWRRSMPADQRRLVSTLTAGSRRAFGY